MPGTLFVVATPIGNLEDITTRALRVLREVAIIAAEDTRRTAHLLSRYAIPTPTTSLHEHNETGKSRMLIARLERGDNVALVSDAGTPTVSDPGQRLIEQAIAAGIRIESVPGPSAVVTALAASGFPSDAFAFMGFPPTRSKDRSEWLQRLAVIGGTVVFFEAPHRILRTLQEIQAEIGDRPVAVCRELTKAHEELVRGPISTVLGRLETIKGEFTVVIDIGLTTEHERGGLPSAPEMAIEIGLLTNNGLMSKRQAIASVARKRGLATNEVYRLLEEAKKSVL